MRKGIVIIALLLTRCAPVKPELDAVKVQEAITQLQLHVIAVEKHLNITYPTPSPTPTPTPKL